MPILPAWSPRVKEDLDWFIKWTKQTACAQQPSLTHCKEPTEGIPYLVLAPGRVKCDMVLPPAASSTPLLSCNMGKWDSERKHIQQGGPLA